MMSAGLKKGEKKPEEPSQVCAVFFRGSDENDKVERLPEKISSLVLSQARI